MALKHFKFFFALVAVNGLVSSVELDHHIIFVDTVNGINNSSCWFGADRFPCKSISLAAQGKHHIPNSIIAVLPNSLQTVKFPTSLLNKTCYPWMLYNKTDDSCECSNIPERAISCDPTIPRTSILDCYCITYDIERQETHLGKCLFGCDLYRTDSLYNKLPPTKANLTEHTCGYAGRTSTLCGKCKPGYSPLVYSYDMSCINCTGMTYNWIKYIAVAYIPLTFFFLFVVVFRFSGTTPWMRAFITICQGLASPIAIRFFLRVGKHRMNTSIRILGLIYGFFNLDFFRTVISPICLDITPLQALALDYAIAFYPLLLVLTTYILIKLYSRDVRIIVWLWKPLRKYFISMKNNWNFEGSVVNAFATFFLLSYLKLLDVSFDMLIYTKVYTLSNSSLSFSTQYVLYFDASVDYFGPEHLPYALLAISVMMIMILFPIAFFIIYPMRCFQQCLNSYHIRRQSLDIFMNCYQGFYKDGTDGTKDCRFFSVLFFLLQISMFIFFMVARNIYCYPICAAFVTLVTALQICVRPYKEKFREYNTADAFIMIIFATIMIMATATNEANLKATTLTDFSYALRVVLMIAPLVYATGFSIRWAASKGCIKYLPCFKKSQRQKNTEVERPKLESSLPHRLQNPTDYATPDSDSEKRNTTNQHTKYGTATLNRQ